MTEGRVQQDGPTGRGEFTYVDISSIDRTTKRIVDAQKLPIGKAPSRALPPLAEQSRIVAEVERRLSVVEELEATVEANLQRATRLRQSILQKAFEGKLA